MRNRNILIKDHSDLRSKERRALKIHCPNFLRKTLNGKISFFTNLQKCNWIKGWQRWLTGVTVWCQFTQQMSQQRFLTVSVFQTRLPCILYPITISSNLSRNTFPFSWSRPRPVQAVTRLWLLYWAVNFSGPWLTLTGTRLQILLHGSILTGCCHTQTVTREREPSLHQVQVSQYNWLHVVWKWVINLYSPQTVKWCFVAYANETP